MRLFLKLCSIVSLIIASIKIAMIGNLSQGLVAFTIICGVLFLVGNRKVYIITAAVASIVFFIKLSGGNSIEQYALLQSILTLAVVCFGVYIMFGGLKRKKNSNHSY